MHHSPEDAQRSHPADRAAPAWSRRRWIGGVAAGVSALWAGAARSQAGGPSRRGSVLRFGADPSGKKDNSAALAEAIRQFDIVDVPAGTFQIGNVVLRAGLTLVGEGERSILSQGPGQAFALIADSGSPALSANLRKITVRNLQLRGHCDVQGFSEHVHLLSLNGVSDASIERVTFRGFRGDGLNLGSSHQARGERHNQRVAVRECVFDGINHENRNGISVIDCDGLVVEKCRFVDMTRHDMPGAIDLEPNANAFHVIRDVRLSGNTFAGIGGAATIAMYIPKPLTAQPSNIVVEDNTIDDTGTTAFALAHAFAPVPGSPGQAIVIRNNRVRGTARPFDLRGVTGVDLRYNRFEGATRAAQIGYRESRDAVRNIALRGNQFQRCGSEEGAAIAVFSVTLLVFADNQWIDCGNGKPGSCAIDFVDGASQRVSFSANRFSSPTGKMLAAIQKEARHRFDAGSNVYAADNVIEGNLRNAFEAKGRPAR